MHFSHCKLGEVQSVSRCFLLLAFLRARDAAAAPAVGVVELGANLCPTMLSGLEGVRSFCTAAEARSLLAAATRLSAQATAASQAAPGAARASAAHNVNSRELFRSLVLPLDEGGSAQCEHFDRYADGHSLTYFRGRLPTLGAQVGPAW